MAMVGGVEDKGYKDQIRCWPDGASSENLMEFLLEQPRNFVSKDPKPMRPRFIGFGIDYDDAQILKDLPYDKLWEIQKGIPGRTGTTPMRARDAADGRSGEDTAVSVIPGKSIKLARLRDRIDPLEMARAERRLAKTIPRLCRKNRDRGRVRVFQQQ